MLFYCINNNLFVLLKVFIFSLYCIIQPGKGSYMAPTLVSLCCTISPIFLPNANYFLDLKMTTSLVENYSVTCTSLFQKLYTAFTTKSLNIFLYI